MVEGAHSWYNWISYLLGGKPTNWKIIISQKFSCRSKSVKFHIRMPNLGIWPWLQMIWFWRLVGLECRCSIGLGETETLLLKGACKVSCIPGPKGKSSDFIGAQTCQLVLEGLMGRGGQLWSSVGTRTLVVELLRDIHLWTFLEATILALRLGPTQQPIGSIAEVSQAKQPTWQKHSFIHQQTGCLKTSWVHGTSILAAWCSPAQQRIKTQLYSPMAKHQSLLVSHQETCKSI